MNTDCPKTPREEMEAWLTALLLGELSEGEAAAVRALMAHDPELAKLHDRLRQAVALVRETVPQMETPPVPAEPPTLSEKRRQRLLTRFKIPPLKIEDRKPKQRFQFRLIELLVVLTAVAVLAAIVLPTLSRSKSRAQWHYTPKSYLGSDSEATEGVSAPPAAALPLDNAALESTRRSATDFNKHLEQAERKLSKTEGDKRIVGNRVQISGQLAASSAVNPPAQIILPAMTESSAGSKGTEVALENYLSWNGGALNGRGFFDDLKKQTVENTTLFTGDPKGTGVLEKPESQRSENAFIGRYAYFPSKSESSGQPVPEADTGLSRSRLQEALKNSSDVSSGVEQLGAVILPSAGLPAAITPPSDGVVAQPTPAMSEQLAFRSRYGLPAVGQTGGTGGGGGGLGGAAPPAPQPTPAQTPPGYVVVGDTTSSVPLLGDLPSAGKLFRSKQPPSENRSFGFSLLGSKPQPDQLALGKTHDLGAAASNGWADYDNDGYLSLFARKDAAKTTGGDWFAGNIQTRERSVAAQSAPPSIVAAEESAGRKSSAIALPPVKEATAGAPIVEAENIEALARGGTAPARLLRASGSQIAGAPTSTPAPARADEQLLAENRLNDAVEARPKNRGRIPTDSAPEQVVAAQKEKDEATTKVTDGRILLAAGKLADAEVKFRDAIKADPENRAANYYLSLAKEPRFAGDDRGLERDSKMGPTEITQAVGTPGQITPGRIVVHGFTGEKIRGAQKEVEPDAAPIRQPSTNAPIPQPEIQTSENNFSTFSLNVSDVSFKLAAASLEKGQMPDPASVRSEEFINALDYRDPEPPAGAPIAFAWERARYPFAHNRDLLRFSLKTAAAGRQAGRPLNIVLLLDNSGSMERADRVQIIRQALSVLASQLQPHDRLSVIAFARTARLVADGVAGDKAGEALEQVSGLTPQGGTNLEEAMNLAYQTALRHYLAGGINRVVLLTDGAANLGIVEPDTLKQKVEAHRKEGVALDCFGIGWEGFNDDLLEVLSRNGDGRYGFINSPEEAATDFAGQLAGALQVAASDVKVQVEFNPRRVTSYRQIGYAKHQLTKEQFRDNTVDAAEIAAQEAGNALYTVEVNPSGEGAFCTVRVRYKIPGTTDYREQAWDVPYTGNALSLEQSSPAMRLAASASAFSEWLVASPFAGEVRLDALLGYLSGVPEVFGADARPKKLEWMIRQAKSLEGK